MSRKATNKGTCQVCGCVQKLPGGHLSLHGYTVRWSFFEGVCAGAEALPFEQSKHLIDGAIARALAQKAGLQEQQAKLLAPVKKGENKTWVRLYYGQRTKWDDGYQWKEVTITSQFHEYTDKTCGPGGYTTFHHDAPPPEKRMPCHNRWDHVCDYSYPKSVEEVVATLNKQRSDFLQKTVDQLDGYVSWQRQRIKGWKVKPLLPLGKA